MNENKGRKGGLDFDPSNVGAQADAYNVADTAALLVARILAHRFDKAPAGWYPRSASRHAVALHVISGKLHRLDERACNEDLGCPKCMGEGEVAPGNSGAPFQKCPRCEGTGSSLHRRVASLMADAQEIAAHYGLTAYHQGDCRGCALYLVEPADLNNRARSYTDGHAVCRLGR